MDDLLQDLVEAIVRQAPVYLVLVAGLAFSVARFGRHRTASAWAIVGFGWLLGFGLLADAWRDLRLYELVIPDDAAHWVIDALSCALFTGLQSVGLVYLLIAVYAGRPWREDIYVLHSGQERDLQIGR